MPVARVQAQAKVNLFLRVGPRDASGYHDILTYFQRIDLADDVLVDVSGSRRRLELNGAMLPDEGLGPAERNLAYRAAVAYAERAGWPDGFSIELQKNIPVGGGLGGGSADAAAVLRILEALAPKPIGPVPLLEVAATLGADVSFLTSEHVSAIATGRGEKLEATPSLPSRPVVLVVPFFSIATPHAYRWLDESRPQPDVAPRLPKLIVRNALDSWESFPTLSIGGNDFEAPVEGRYPTLGAIREQLTKAGAILSRLAGSGSTVFGVFDDVDPLPRIGVDETLEIRTRTSSRVVQVVVQE